MPSSKSPSGADWLRRQPVAHRGLHDAARGVPENSLAAFRAAIEGGFAIELDVQLSADGVAMVFHDAKLARMTGAKGLIGARPAAALGRLHLLKTRETIPTLRQVLDEVGGREPILVEIKNNSARVGPLEMATLAAIEGYRGAIAVQSFNPGTVAWFQQHAPHLPRGQLRHNIALSRGLSIAQKLRYRALIRRDAGAPDFVGWNVAQITKREARRNNELRRPILVWTVRTERAKAKARALGANLIFEHIRP
ncbi:MAG: glycerophosphodiester phosphodiesterase [Alphaproteobacteria bacterium]|nr:glycerophosphodiester phosphodiesterase [Alphaproteobacteria bacterium]